MCENGKIMVFLITVLIRNLEYSFTLANICVCYLLHILHSVFLIFNPFTFAPVLSVSYYLFILPFSHSYCVTCCAFLYTRYHFVSLFLWLPLPLSLSISASLSSFCHSFLLLFVFPSSLCLYWFLSLPLFPKYLNLFLSLSENLSYLCLSFPVLSF